MSSACKTILKRPWYPGKFTCANNNIGADRSSQSLNDFDCYYLHLYRVPEELQKNFNIPDFLRHIIVRKRVKITPHSCERKIPHLRERKNCEAMVKLTCTCIFTLKRYWEFH